MAIATDLGYMPPNVKAALKRIDVLLLESNHDLEMLRDGPYPWSVKQRVLSRVGHLSNHATAEFLARDYDGGAAYIVLGHLSESNNAPELALLAAEQALGSRMTLLGNRVLLAQQDAPLASICLCNFESRVTATSCARSAGKYRAFSITCRHRNIAASFLHSRLSNLVE